MVAACAPFVHCVTRRTVVTRPAVTVTVVDASGAPVADASVTIYWWSYPHRVLHERYDATTGPEGQTAFTRATKRETVTPMCMHGVPQHAHTVCVTAAGKGEGELELARGADAVTVTLAAGPASGCARLAADHARAGSTPPRAD